jgi:hypothetical protein
VDPATVLHAPTPTEPAAAVVPAGHGSHRYAVSALALPAPIASKAAAVIIFFIIMFFLLLFIVNLFFLCHSGT